MPNGLDQLGNEANAFFDFQQLDALRARARNKSPDSIQESAKQFESLFIKMMIKSMRQASPGDELLDSDATRFYQDMFDEQISLNLSAQGSFGLADMLVKQMTLGQAAPQDKQGALKFDRTAMTVPVDATPAMISQYIKAYEQARQGAAKETSPAATVVAAGSDSIAAFSSVEEFTSRLWPLASNAGKRIGLQAQVLIAQAALETGWGRAMSRKQNGEPSHNLFNIKANADWKGERAFKETTEYRNGKANREVAAFRAYDSYEKGFDDYIQFLQHSPRYQQALQHAGDARRFVSELQRAGYATDPDYAAKIEDIMARDSITMASSLFATPATANALED